MTEYTWTIDAVLWQLLAKPRTNLPTCTALHFSYKLKTLKVASVGKKSNKLCVVVSKSLSSVENTSSYTGGNGVHYATFEALSRVIGIKEPLQ